MFKYPLHVASVASDVKAALDASDALLVTDHDGEAVSLTTVDETGALISFTVSATPGQFAQVSFSVGCNPAEHSLEEMLDAAMALFDMGDRDHRDGLLSLVRACGTPMVPDPEPTPVLRALAA